MANETTVKGITPGVGSPEYVAYLLLCSIGQSSRSIGTYEIQSPIVYGQNKDWILDTYAECLHVVRHGFREGK